MKINVIEIEDDDTLIFAVPIEKYGVARSAEMAKMLQRVFSDNKVVVMDKNTAILKKSQLDNEDNI